MRLNQQSLRSGQHLLPSSIVRRLLLSRGGRGGGRASRGGEQSREQWDKQRRRRGSTATATRRACVERGEARAALSALESPLSIAPFLCSSSHPLSPHSVRAAQTKGECGGLCRAGGMRAGASSAGEAPQTSTEKQHRPTARPSIDPPTGPHPPALPAEPHSTPSLSSASRLLKSLAWRWIAAASSRNEQCSHTRARLTSIAIESARGESRSLARLLTHSPLWTRMQIRDESPGRCTRSSRRSTIHSSPRTRSPQSSHRSSRIDTSRRGRRCRILLVLLCHSRCFLSRFSDLMRAMRRAWPTRVRTEHGRAHLLDMRSR